MEWGCEMSEAKLDKTTFEKIINQKANDIYKAKVSELETLIGDYFRNNQFMNSYSTGSSVSYQLFIHLEGLFKSKKEDIIKAIEKIEMNKILDNLNNVRFLFEDQNYDR